MKNVAKYKKNYFMPPEMDWDWVKKESVAKAPAWCSVDLRDGNQALVVPMSLEQKIEFFKFLVKIGFKEIEVGFPAASETEYDFLRALVEQNLIPDDVTIQVLTQARPHIIARTFAALDGVKKAVVHLYNSTSVAQREQVFKKSKEEIIKIGVEGAKMLKDFAAKTKGNFQFEYSPESFTGTEMEFALEICNAVLDVWQPTADNKVIINLPATVAMSMPHVYACQVAYMSQNLKYRENVIISLHPHNDRGCAVADAEMGLLAGGDRIEGTLFGNGERTGNVDIVTLALNMYSQGIDPELELGNIPEVIEVYEESTGMKVYDRHPYGGKLVFAAFSGSHQDAITKGMRWKEEKKSAYWTVPYLLIDPKDIGREYDGDVIRINSQSGKGGIGYLLEQKYGLDLPAKMREDFGYAVKSVSDHQHKELMPEEIYEIFQKQYVNLESPLKLVKFHFTNAENEDDFTVEVKVLVSGEEKIWQGTGNGQLDAVSAAVHSGFSKKFEIVTYQEHALEVGSKSQAVAYVGVKDESDKTVWGTGMHTDIMTASIKALLSAVNKLA